MSTRDSAIWLRLHYLATEKFVPTGPERLIWAQGDGSTLSVFDTPFGKISGLICSENYMPLARYALYAGTQIYIAATVARGEDWLATLRHIAMEGRVFVIGCGIVERKSDIPDRYAFKQPTSRISMSGSTSATVRL